MRAELVEICENDPAVAPSCVAHSKTVAFHGCEQIAIAIVGGPGATVSGETLGPGDVLVATGAGVLELKSISGATRAVIAIVQQPTCQAATAGAPITRRVVRASAAPELVWADGRMRAHLDVGRDVSPNAYIGRLEGAAPVAEHAHSDSWEILCAVEGAGTFTRDGKNQRLGAGDIVTVPPGVKHAWNPDPGTNLVAVQIYAPPGPEQRFKALAAAALDAGAR